MIGLRCCRFKYFECVFNHGDQFRMLAKFARVKRPHSVERASDVFEVEPTLMTPTKSDKDAVKRSRTEVSLRKGEKFAPASKASRFGRVPAKVGESTTECVSSVNGVSGR